MNSLHYYSNFLLVLVTFALFHSTLIVSVTTKNENIIKGFIGAIVDGRFRVGKEVRVAMEMAINDFSNQTQHEVVLRIKNSFGQPLNAAMAAKTLVRRHNVQAILGPQTWEETSAVAETLTKQKIPILSLADPTPPWSTTRWPNLISSSPSTSSQMKAVADIARSWGWWRINVVYEDSDTFSHSIFPGLYEALRDVGVVISSAVAVPSESDDELLSREMERLDREQCRVFVVHGSLEMAEVVFEKAKVMGMMQKGYVWITTDAIASLAHSMDSSAIGSMQGVLGIQSYYNQSGDDYQNFNKRFQQKFRSMFMEERNYEPSIFAVRAYDITMSLAIAMTSNNAKTTNLQEDDDDDALLQKIVKTELNGLSGKIQFKNRRLDPAVHVFRIINVIGKSYHDLGFWTDDRGFSEEIDGSGVYNKSMENLLPQVFWPGSPKSAPRGWEFPTTRGHLRIGVPNNTLTRTFVSIDNYDPSSKEYSFSGFSVKVFELTMKFMKYHVPYKFIPFNGNYDALVEQVHLKEFDAAVGDIAITPSRYELAEFTHSHTETGLVMIVPNQPQSKRAWLFMKPFTMTMWILTFIINVYNGFVIWMIEKNYSSHLKGGSALNQIGSLIWLAFTTLFSPLHGELHSNLSRMATLVWLFVALILTQSYTASLASMLTVQKLEPKVTDVQTLKTTNAKVGCSYKAFVSCYLQNVIGFREENIKLKIQSMEEGADALKKGEITALFLEAPVGKIFLAKYCKSFALAGPTFKIGGYGFAFPKGSPMLADVDEALLKAFESSEFVDLENSLTALEKCVDNHQQTGEDNEDKESLSPSSFCVLFSLTGCTSTAALLIYAFYGKTRVTTHISSTLSERRRIWEMFSMVWLHMNSIKNRNKICQAPSRTSSDVQLTESPGIV